MKFIKKIRKSLQQHRTVIVLASLVLPALALYQSLGAQAVRDANLRKNPVALNFEGHADDWLLHSTDVSTFRKALEAGELSAVGQASNPPNLLLYTLKNGKKASVRVPNCNNFVCAGTVMAKLEDQSISQGFAFVRIDVDPRAGSQQLLDLVGAFTGPVLTMLSMVAAMYTVFKLQSGTGGAASKLTERPELAFKDVIGNAEAKAQLIRVKTFIQNPATYSKIGAKPPRGVLLVGPPGTGKTLLAKALAGESRANFIAVDGSYFTSMFYGAGIAKVKALFELARKNAPCVLFIDEVDGISKRTQSPEMRGADSESNRIINRILVEMDGFEDMTGVVVVAATNYESNVDEALRRPGRFDALVRMALPTLPDRKALFEMYLDKVTRDANIDTSMLARMTAGVSPAEVANLVNKASSCAAETQAPCVQTAHVVNAIETFRMGGEVSPIKELLTEGTRRRLAYHEAAHALVGHQLEVGVVEHLTIEPRGEALGVTYITRGSEDPLYRADELANRIAMTLAGREAELLIFGDVSSGAADDLKKATELACTMVSTLGFSTEFGVLSIAGVPKELLSPDTQSAVLRGARDLLETGQKTCQTLLQSRKTLLDRIAATLLEKEVLSGTELQLLLNDAASDSTQPEAGPVQITPLAVNTKPVV